MNCLSNIIPLYSLGLMYSLKYLSDLYKLYTHFIETIYFTKNILHPSFFNYLAHHYYVTLSYDNSKYYMVVACTS
jgi:hypothetical protein